MKHLKKLLEGTDIRCPVCSENFGKDTENSKKIKCGNCGETVNNPRGEDDDPSYYEPMAKARPHTSGYNKLSSGSRAAADSRARAFMHEDEEDLGGEREDNDGSMDNYDIAIDMINQAVERHNALDEFDKIADVESLVDHLRATRHDFTDQIEQNVRDIIADETGSNEEEEARPAARTTPRFKPSKQSQYYRDLDNKEYRGKLKRAARLGDDEEEEEYRIPRIDMDKVRAETKATIDDSRKRKMARDYGISGPSRRSRGVRRRGTGSARGTFGLEQEEEIPRIDMDKVRAETKATIDDSRKRKMARDYGISGRSRRSGGVRRRDLGRSRGTFGLEQEEQNDDCSTGQCSHGPNFRGKCTANLDDTLNQRRRQKRPGVRDEGSDTRRNRVIDPKRAFARQMARKARQHVGFEQEEKSIMKSDEEMSRDSATRKAKYRTAIQRQGGDDDWNEEVRKFRERRPENDYGRASRRMIDRRRNTPSRSPFSVGFEQEEDNAALRNLKKGREDRKTKVPGHSGVGAGDVRRRARRMSRRAGLGEAITFKQFFNETK